MKTLNLSLQDDTDAGLLPLLAKVWKVNPAGLERAALLAALRDAMLEPTRAEAVWDGLNDVQRGAVQMLIGSGGKMPASKFGRLFGEIRQMGAAQIERENPLKNPASAAEALFYRGLVAQMFEVADTGPRVVIYVPEDLGRALPLRKTSYGDLQPDPADVAAVAGATAQDDLPGEALVEPLKEVTGVKQADTSVVDDVTTLLAYLQLYSPLLEGDTLAEVECTRLRKNLLKADDERLSFVLALALSADIAEVQAGKVYPKRTEARRWLSATRAEQVKVLAESWRGSTFYRELWHVPGLYPDPGGELDEYNAAVARSSVLEIMTDLVPRQEWWSLEAFITAVKETEPDFQRPGGDYQSWYIRGEDGEYLMGFDNWEAVEGALLEYTVIGPMHWLGLIDRADEAARLTAYGRAFLGQAAWPTPADPEDKIVVKDDGTLLISRKVARVDRFQAARFTTWGAAGDPYSYKLDAAGIQQAAGQGINAGHISSFIARALGDAPVPASISRLLENWQSGPSANVSLEKLQVLRTTAPETLDKILDTPALRRYLGARLGPMTVIVRAGQWDMLKAALGEQGILVEVVE